MDNIFPIIVLLIVVWSIFSKIKQTKKQMGTGGKPAKSGGLVERINAYLSEVQRQMEEEAARKKQDAGAADLSDWSRLVDEQEVEMPARPMPARPMAEERLDDLVLEEVAPPIPEPKPARPVRPAKPAARVLRGKETSPPAPPEPVMAAESKPVATRTGSRADLRRAIVWSEILGPPVGLRDSGSDRF